jgi:hypothetical protein
MAVEAEREVENPAEALRNAEGTFRVTSPYGDVFQVICRKGRNMHIREISNSEHRDICEVAHHDRFDPAKRKWQIEKIA